MKKILLLIAAAILCAVLAVAGDAHDRDIDFELAEKIDVEIVEPADQEALIFLAKIDRACNGLYPTKTFDDTHRDRQLNELGQIARGKIMEAIRDELEPSRSMERMHDPLPKGKIRNFLLRVARSLPTYIDQEYGDKDGKLNEHEQWIYSTMLQFSNIALREFALLVFEYEAVPPLSKMSKVPVEPATADPFPILPPVVALPETPPTDAAEPEAPAPYPADTTVDGPPQ